MKIANQSKQRKNETKRDAGRETDRGCLMESKDYLKSNWKQGNQMHRNN